MGKGTGHHCYLIITHLSFLCDKHVQINNEQNPKLLHWWIKLPCLKIQHFCFFIPGVQKRVTRRAEEETTSQFFQCISFCTYFICLLRLRIKVDNAIPKRVTFVRNFDLDLVEVEDLRPFITPLAFRQYDNFVITEAIKPLR